MRKKKQTVFLILSVVLLLFFLSITLIAQNHLSYTVLSNGGQKQSNSNFILEGSVGQVGVDIITNPNHHIQPGFWNLYYQDVIVDMEQEDIQPIEYKLEQNYPNPFNPSTIIKFAVPERSIVVIKIYDILGSEIQTLANDEMD